MNETNFIRNMIKELREEYSRGGNVMELARKCQLNNNSNHVTATLIAYDLQSGKYIENVNRAPDSNYKWCEQISSIISPIVNETSSLLEIGCGETTTLTGVLKNLKSTPNEVMGFDISWSRLFKGLEYLKLNQKSAKLFVADLFSIPLKDDSIDVVYSSHSLEPNGGREREAITELLRISRRWVVLIEPIFELASPDSQKRMEKHGYIKNLYETGQKSGAKIIDYRLLEYAGNPLNPSGVLILEKMPQLSTTEKDNYWSCPITNTPLFDTGEVFLSKESGLIYPIIKGIPLLRPEHAIVASAYIEPEK